MLGLCDIHNDKSDSRSFFYKNPKQKWRGVMINVAHNEARKFFGIWTVLPMMVLPIVVAGLAIRGVHKTNPVLFWKSLGVLVALHLLYTVGTVLYAFRMASKEEKDENRYWK